MILCIGVGVNGVVDVVAMLAEGVVDEEATATLADFFSRVTEFPVLRVRPLAFMAAFDFSVHGLGQVGVVWPGSLQLKHFMTMAWSDLFFW